MDNPGPDICLQPSGTSTSRTERRSSATRLLVSALIASREPSFYRRLTASARGKYTRRRSSPRPALPSILTNASLESSLKLGASTARHCRGRCGQNDKAEQ
jgi:hypothetical protein